MKQVNSKREIIESFNATRQQILQAALGLPVETHAQAFVGSWNICDLIAHLIGWDHANHFACQAVQNNRLPEFYEHVDKDWRSYNALLVKKYNTGSLKDLAHAARDSLQMLTEYLLEIPETAFSKDFGVRYKGYKVIIARLIQSETKDEQKHLAQIQAFYQALQ